MADKLHRALDDFSRQIASRREAWRQGAVELGILVAAHFLKHSVESGTFPWSDVIDEMTATLTGTPLEVRLHPTDLEVWQRAGHEPALPPGVRLVADGQLRRGECLVASDIEVRLHSLADRLRSARETLLREWERDPI
ncbi:MAG: FliH/SctL family protein [Gemmataceae bacterium]|nr:FliH/SctL family protein [Gemmataceae bacterium]